MKIIRYIKFEHFQIDYNLFLSCAPIISVKMNLNRNPITVPWPLSFDLSAQNHVSFRISQV